MWPYVAVFATVVALNCLLGSREILPFSMYPMFSQPTTATWSLSFQDPDGALVPLGMMGYNPQIAKKRFATELGVARSRGISDLAEIRRYAGAVVVEEIHEHRMYQGPWAAKPIIVVFVEYSVESGELVKTLTPVGRTKPR